MKVLVLAAVLVLVLGAGYHLGECYPSLMGPDVPSGYYLEVGESWCRMIPNPVYYILIRLAIPLSLSLSGRDGLPMVQAPPPYQLGIHQELYSPGPNSARASRVPAW